MGIYYALITKWQLELARNFFEPVFAYYESTAYNNDEYNFSHNI